MRVLTLDFETYWSSDYTLTKMKTEAYVRDPRFQALCVGMRFDAGTIVCVPMHQIKDVFARVPWHEVALVGQNTMFDAFILSHIYGHHPAFLIDTKSIFNRAYPHERANLHNITKVLRLPPKGHEVMSSKGKRYEDFTPQEFALLMDYCKNDVLVTWLAWQKLKPTMPLTELQMCDMSLRMFTHPQLELDPAPLDAEIASEIARKEELLSKIGATKKQLMSNPQLAAILEEMGVDVPIKAAAAEIKRRPELKQFVEDFNMWLLTHDFPVNEKTLHITGIDEDGEPEYGETPAYPWTYAFAKNDTNFKHLLQHPNEEVAMIVEARLGVKSTINQTRAQTMKGICDRGLMPVPLAYWAAGTGRWGGTQGINLQNLTRGSRLRYAIKAPKGMMLVVCDLSAIEARVNAWFSGQDDVTEIFATGGDIYCVMAQNLYGRTVTKADKEMRRLGKTVVLGCGFQMSWRRFYEYALGQDIVFGATDLEQFGLNVDGFMANKSNYTFVKVNRPRHWSEHAFATHCCVSEYIIKVYRTANYMIKNQWQDCSYALEDMYAGRERSVGQIEGLVVTSKNQLNTPNNRILYPNLTRKVTVLDSGKQRVEFTRASREGVAHIHGGLVLENCVAADTLVLTRSGFRAIVQVTKDDEVWDGVEWVSHAGVVHQGQRGVISVLGVRCTPDHRFLTGYNEWTEAKYVCKRWFPARAHPRLNRASFWAALSGWVCRVQEREAAGIVASTVLLWLGRRKARQVSHEGDDSVVRVSAERGVQRAEENPRDVNTPRVRRMAQYVRSVPSTNTQGIQELWCQGYSCMRAVAQWVRGVLGGYGGDIRARTNTRPQGERTGLHPRELSVGGVQGAGAQHQEQRAYPDTTRRDATVRSSGANRTADDDTLLPSGGGMAGGEDVRRAGQKEGTRRQDVFDIADAGPRHRFTILTARGPMIVHNCVQHLARQIMAEQMLEARRAGLNVVLTCHDEIVCLEPEHHAQDALMTLEQIMSTAPVWAPRLPVACEGGIAENYGEAK